jgi:hypothetical protein
MLTRLLRGKQFHRSRSFCSGVTTPNPSAIFQRVISGDIDGALKACEPYCGAVKLSPVEFLSKQCSERSYLIYRLSIDSRQAALEISQSGQALPEDIKASELLDIESLWPEEVKEQYHRAFNCINLSQTGLKLDSPNPARDWQIIGKSVVWKLLFGRTACVLQSFMSNRLSRERKVHEWAMNNHRSAARLFDDYLSPPGPVGPLEEPDKQFSPEEFRQWADTRNLKIEEFHKLLIHLVSDVSRHVLSREEGLDFLSAAEVIFHDEIENDKIRKYATSVINTTRKKLA